MTCPLLHLTLTWLQAWHAAAAAALYYQKSRTFQINLTGLTFPKISFGKTKVVKCAYQASWFKKFQWLHYSTTDDLAYCFTCVEAEETGKLKNTGHVNKSA